MVHLISSPIRHPEQKFTFHSFLAVCFCASVSRPVKRIKAIMRFTMIMRIIIPSPRYTAKTSFYVDSAFVLKSQVTQAAGFVIESKKK
jgi:hypothetical protein